MQEDFLHYIWKHKKFNFLNLTTTSNQALEIQNVGQHNLNSGPDFFNARLKIDNQLWAGNVEIHLKSSDWFLHNHEKDNNYDNVILHVVWDDDTEIFRKDNTIIPTLELKSYVNSQALNNYKNLLNKKSTWINCEKNIDTVDNFLVSNWLERLYFERLERKSIDLIKLLESSKNNWEEVLFKTLAKNFGLKVNGDSFLSIAESFDFKVLLKQRSKILSLEGLLFGQADLLKKDIQDSYFLQLQQEYEFLKRKYKLSNQNIVPLKFFRLRPDNFPTIRLSQLVNLYAKHQNVFSEIINADTLEDFYAIFSVKATKYWDKHYTFGKESNKRSKKLSKSFIDLLLINSIIPLVFTYFKTQGKSKDEKIINLIQNLKSEKNSIINKFQDLKIISLTALHSQALIQLKTTYCDNNKCLQCAIGSALLNRNM